MYDIFTVQHHNRKHGHICLPPEYIPDSDIELICQNTSEC
jgi:hypothetical protein